MRDVGAAQGSAEIESGRAGRKESGETLSVCGGRADCFERFSAEYSGELSLRVGQQFPCVLRSLSGFEIGRAGAKFAAGAVRADRAVLERGLELLGIEVPERM